MELKRTHVSVFHPSPGVKSVFGKTPDALLIIQMKANKQGKKSLKHFNGVSGKEARPAHGSSTVESL